jgi:hypothetical protein
VRSKISEAADAGRLILSQRHTYDQSSSLKPPYFLEYVTGNSCMVSCNDNTEILLILCDGADSLLAANDGFASTLTYCAISSLGGIAKSF